jgi:predicted amidohydrolase YtcJ
MRDAMLRRTAGGAFIGRAEALPAAEALELYTRNAAFVSHHDDRVGSLEVGKLADFVVLDRDPLDVPAEALDEALVRMTVVGGAVVHDRNGV